MIPLGHSTPARILRDSAWSAPYPVTPGFFKRGRLTGARATPSGGQRWPWCSRMRDHSTFCLVGMACMDLLKKDHVIHDVEPDAGITLEGGLVLPPLMGRPATLHNTQLTA